MSYYSEPDGQLTFLNPESPQNTLGHLKQRAKPKSMDDLIAIPFLYLDLSLDHVDLFGKPYWELHSPYREGKPPLNTGPAPREPIRRLLSEILEKHPDKKHYLSKIACLGILRRAEGRGKPLPSQLQLALMAQSGMILPPQAFHEMKAYHINQRDEGIDLGGVSGALMATSNMQMQTFITEKTSVPSSINQGDEVSDLHTSCSLSGRPSGKQHAFAAGFSAGAGASAGSIGYSETVAPTLKAATSGNCMPAVLCLNDQGGKVMGCSEDVTGTLRAQEHGHQPLVYENHGIDARYTGPHPIAPTLSARAGTGGNNLPLVSQEVPEAICIMGPAIDRQPHNGGNGIGYQENISYTLTAADHYAVFSRKRVDKFEPDSVASTESARQHKDATDLVLQPEKENCPLLIRRLTPLECERLQGFPDGWTGIPGASDSHRYKALGNSVAIPCVEFILRGITMTIRSEEKAANLLQN